MPKTPKKESSRFRVCSHCGSVLTGPIKKDAHEEIELTERQRDVLRYTAMGLTAQEIADELEISRRTAEFHRMVLMQKFNVHSTAELALCAAALRLI